MLLKTEALEIAARLEPCPFCGCALTASVHGPKEWTTNPKASCKTEDCWGARLPVLPLDVPEYVAAWNKRAARPLQGEIKQ